MSLERFKALKDKRSGVTPPSPAVPPKATPLKGNTKGKAVARTTKESVVHVCGHTTTVAHFESQACGSCQAAARAERAAKKGKKRGEKKPRPDAAWTGRYPHKTRLVFMYDAEKVIWEGGLFIADDKGEPKAIFKGELSAVEKLFRSLCQEYRLSLQETEVGGQSHRPIDLCDLCGGAGCSACQKQPSDQGD